MSDSRRLPSPNFNTIHLVPWDVPIPESVVMLEPSGETWQVQPVSVPEHVLVTPSQQSGAAVGAALHQIIDGRMGVFVGKGNHARVYEADGGRLAIKQYVANDDLETYGLSFNGLRANVAIARGLELPECGAQPNEHWRLRGVSITGAVLPLEMLECPDYDIPLLENPQSDYQSPHILIAMERLHALPDETVRNCVENDPFFPTYEDIVSIVKKAAELSFGRIPTLDIALYRETTRDDPQRELVMYNNFLVERLPEAGQPGSIVVYDAVS